MLIFKFAFYFCQIIWIFIVNLAFIFPSFLIYQHLFPFTICFIVMVLIRLFNCRTSYDMRKWNVICLAYIPFHLTNVNFQWVSIYICNNVYGLI
jgi:hypothetical protein